MQSIGKLVHALVEAQKEFKKVLKDTDNPFYHSKYADLAGIIAATTDALTKNGLVVIQLPVVVDKTAGVQTILAHTSGEYVENTLLLPAESVNKEGKVRFDAQSSGSAITYARRYAYQAVIGVAAEVDDDGNTASGIESRPVSGRRTAQAQIKTKPVGVPRAEIPATPFPPSEAPPISVETLGGYQATNDDLPEDLVPLPQAKAMPYIRRVQAHAKTLGTNGMDRVKEYIFQTTGKKESKELTKPEWERIVENLGNIQNTAEASA